MLGDAFFDIPLLCVNREAREIAVKWAAEQDIQLESQTVEDRNHLPDHPSFVGPLLALRSLDPECDVMYVSLDDWHEFYCGPGDRALEPDMMARNHTIHCEIARLAVPEALIRQPRNPAYLMHLFQPWGGLRAIYITLDPQPDGVSETRSVPPRWEIEEIPVLEMVWLKGEWSEWNNKGSQLDGGFLRSLKKAAEELHQGLVELRGGYLASTWTFKIRVVSTHWVGGTAED